VTTGGDALQRAPGVLDSVLGDEVLLLPPGGRTALRLSPTAAAAWQQLAAPVAAEALVARLATSYGVAPEVVAADVLPLLDLLLAEGALVRAEGRRRR
jgi:hypothetical protein